MHFLTLRRSRMDASPRGESIVEKMRREGKMTREEREQEIEKRQRVIDGMLRWISEDKREPTQRERETIQHYRNVISSLKLGLENEFNGAE
jgi:hypothetical protein